MGRTGLIWLTAYLFAYRHASSPLAAAGGAALVTAVWMATVYALGPATRLVRAAIGSVGRQALCSFVGFVAVSGLSLWAPWIGLRPLTVLATAAGIFLVSLGWEEVAARGPASRQRVLVVGAADGGADLVDELAVTSDCPFEVIGFVDDDWPSDRIRGARCFGGLDDLPWVLEVQRPDLVVLAVSRNRPEAFASLLHGASTGFELLGLAEFHEQAFGRVPVEHVTPAWFMSVLHFYRRPYNQLSKRAFDIVFASLGLLLTAPLFPILALFVSRTPGGIIFRQRRPGESGRPFTMYKFRTMRTDVVAAEGLTEEDDPRITRIGAFMRKRRLDELPQLMNVLKGDMSIVGPRPEPEFSQESHQELPHWIRRRMVKPGITGWAQVRRGYTGSDAASAAQKLSYDLWYLRHRSLLVDLAICARTASVLLSGSGSR